MNNIFASVYQNKNILMMLSVGIYILALFGVMSGNTLIFAFVLTLLLIFSAFKNIFPYKVIIIWALIFYFGIVNTSLRIKETDALLDIAPVNAVLYGKITSIPETRDNGKVQFFFDVNKVEYDGIIRDCKHEKVLVSLNSEEKFNIFDSYKITGRLSVPFKAGNPSQFDYGNYLRNYGTYAVLYGRNPYSVKDSDIKCYEKLNAEKTKKELILQGINNHRERILKVHSKYLPSPNLEILGGIVFGDDAVSPPKNIKQSFVNSGLLHILAASGMNVAFIYSFFFFILNLLKVPFKPNIIICILAVLTYVFMTGLGASVVRAALMLLFVLVGKLINRDANSIALLFFVGFLMLLFNPLLINDVGFQLSFIVTFGLLLMTPHFIKSRYKIVNSIIGSVTVPIVAQIWVIPIQIFYFNNISIYSVFANIMSVPVLFVISFGGFISSLLSVITPIADFVCKVFDLILNPLITFLVNISDFWGQLPRAALQTAHPSPFQILLYYAILILAVQLFNKDFREKYCHKTVYTLVLMIFILCISMITISNKNLEITAFDVGNADAFTIKTPDNKYILIDTGKAGYNGGKSQAEMLIMKYFTDKGIRDIDSVIVTHFDIDHSGGAVDLIKGMNVGTVYVNSKAHESNQAKEILKTAKDCGTKIVEAENMQKVYDSDGVKLINYILKDSSENGDNESSIVSLLEYGGFTMLFTGDAGVKALDKLKQYLPPNITVFKAGHHGAPGVINKTLAEYFNPVYSIISTGENKFGHPSVYTLETLRNSKVLRTDVHNSVKIVVNKNKYKVLTYNPKKKKYTD